MATAQGVLPVAITVGSRRIARWYWSAGAASVLFLIFLFLAQPFWFIDRVTQLRLSFAGMQSEFVTVDGHKIHYLVGGAGEPIVLVHGLGSRATDWAGLIPPLVRNGRRVYAIDLLGYGQSDRPKDAPYSIAEQAQVVEGFLQAEHLRQFDLAGWSMGGWISMVVASRMPQRISHLVLLDSAGLWFHPDFDTGIFTPTDVDQLRQLERLLSPSAPVMPDFLARAFLTRAKPEAWVIHRSVDSMLTGQDVLDHKLGTLTMPVYIGWGEEDHLTPIAMARELHAGIPNSRLEVFDGCGHLAPGLCASKIAPSLIRFLDQPAAPVDGRQQDAALEPVKIR